MYFLKSIDLKPAEAVVYLGCELEHKRENFVGDWHSQVFLHYVNKNGPYGDMCKYDFRPALGLTDDDKDEEKIAAAEKADKNMPYRTKDTDFPDLGKDDVPYENR